MGKLNDLFENSGRKVTWVAKQLGVDQSTVSRWKTGHTPVPDQYVAPLAALFGVGEDEIRNGAPRKRGRRPKATTDTQPTYRQPPLNPAEGAIVGESAADAIVHATPKKKKPVARTPTIRRRTK